MEQVVKQRLIGSIVLVFLFIIFLPIIFDGEGISEMPADLFELPQEGAEETDKVDAASEIGELDPPPSQSDKDRMRTRKIDTLMQDVTVRNLMDKPKTVEVKSGAVESEAKETEESTTSPVRLKVRPWDVQLATYTRNGPAQAFRERLANQGYQVLVKTETNEADTQFYIVILQIEDDYEAVETLVGALSKQYSDINKPIIRRRK